MKPKAPLIRSTFPKISVAYVRGEKCFLVDARKAGTKGGRTFCETEAEARERANGIAAEFATNGREGLAMNAALREMAFRGEKILAPFGKTVAQACEFYRDYLTSTAAKAASGTVEKLAADWLAYKESGAKKKLRKATISNLKFGVAELKRAFPGKTVMDVSEADANAYIESLDRSLQSKHNVCSLFSQFFNWLISKRVITANPCEFIKIEIESGDVKIWTVALAAEAMALCEKEFPEFMTFHALGLFGGLRPHESFQLDWQNVQLAERFLMVLRDTSKVKETRSVPINDTLFAWLSTVPKAERTGLVVPKENFTNRIKLFRARLGYRYITKNKGKAINPNGPRGEYDADILRHCFGSYRLAVRKNRAELAEEMGNSVDVIKAHYRYPVKESVAETFWAIIPAAEVARREARKSEEAAVAEVNAEFDAIAPGAKVVSMADIAKRNAKDKQADAVEKMFGL